MTIDFHNPAHGALLCFALIVYALLNVLGSWCNDKSDSDGWECVVAAVWFIHLFLLTVSMLIHLGILISRTL